MAIPTLIPTAATLSGSVAQDHPHHRVSLGLGTDEIAFGEDKFACQRMEPRPEADEPSPPKKVKREARTVETILKQTAEIGMVLVGMAALRGGAPPTPVECHLAVEAYTNLEGLVERVAPHDLVSQKSLQSLIQQFSLPQVWSRISTWYEPVLCMYAVTDILWFWHCHPSYLVSISLCARVYFLMQYLH